MAKNIKTIKDLRPDPHNANKGTKRGLGMVGDSLSKYGAGRSIVTDRNGIVIGGNKTLESAAAIGLEIEVVKTDGSKLVVVQREDLDLMTDEKARKLAYADNRAGELGLDWDVDQIKLDMDAGLELGDLFGLDDLAELGIVFDDEPEEAPEAQMDAADELQEKWQVKTGDVWQIGTHRLMCGDSTNAQDVAQVMDGAKAQLIHADPPYGMGKEKDGVVNDNLYAEKLDAFQMAWWRTFRPHTEDNGSAYIWGNAADLWRLWYMGGLRDSGRLVIRNFITWNKYIGNVKPTRIEMMRSYCKYREDCLFFMLGEQVFKGKANNELKQEFYASRAYFDNTHDNMTDVWDFPSVKGEERHGHATPKPVAMMARAIKSSCPDDGLVAEPFGGSGTTMVAAEQLGRKCYSMEIEPKYCAVILERMSDMGLIPELIPEMEMATK